MFGTFTSAESFSVDGIVLEYHDEETLERGLQRGISELEKRDMSPEMGP